MSTKGLARVLELPRERILTNPVESEEDIPILARLRPRSWEDFIGHEDKVLVLRRLLDAARKREEQADHLVFYGPPGTGKTVLAELCLSEFDISRSVGLLESKSSLFRELMKMEKGQGFFIDEIHGLGRPDSELLMQAMESTGIFKNSNSKIPPFTLLGCTTRFGKLDRPLRDRFGLALYIDFYKSCQEVVGGEGPHDKHNKGCSAADLNTIVGKAGNRLDMDMQLGSMAEIAQRSRGTPRIAGRLLRRVRDVSDSPSPEVVGKTLVELGIDQFGMEDADRRYLLAVGLRYGGGPVGLKTLGATLGDETESLVENTEPYLIRSGFIEITTRGRKLTPGGMRYAEHVGKAMGVN